MARGPGPGAGAGRGGGRSPPWPAGRDQALCPWRGRAWVGPAGRRYLARPVCGVNSEVLTAKACAHGCAVFGGLIMNSSAGHAALAPESHVGLVPTARLQASMVNNHMCVAHLRTGVQRPDLRGTGGSRRENGSASAAGRHPLEARYHPERSQEAVPNVRAARSTAPPPQALPERLVSWDPLASWSR